MRRRLTDAQLAVLQRMADGSYLYVSAKTGTAMLDRGLKARSVRLATFTALWRRELIYFAKPPEKWGSTYAITSRGLDALKEAGGGR